MITRHQIHVEGKDVETGHLILRNVTQNTESSDTRPLRLGAERRMAQRAYSTEGERVSPPPPGRLAGYLNLATVHSLERELSLLLINEGKSFVRNNIHIYSSCQFSPHACSCSHYFIPNSIQPRYTSHTPQTFHLTHI